MNNAIQNIINYIKEQIKLTTNNWIKKATYEEMLDVARVNLKKHKTIIKVKQFEDHHHYTIDDYKSIYTAFNNLKGDRKYIITTEKDAVRLIEGHSFPEELKPYIFYVPINVQYLSTDTKSFDIELNKLIMAKKLF